MINNFILSQRIIDETSQQMGKKKNKKINNIYLANVLHFRVMNNKEKY